MNTEALLKGILIDTLQLSSDLDFDEETKIINSIPEFNEDTMQQVIVSIESMLGIEFDEGEIEEDIFLDFGTLCEFVTVRL